MWKDFFYYSKGERRAVYVLSALIVIFLVGGMLLPHNEGESQQVAALEKEKVAQFSDSIERLSVQRYPKSSNREKREMMLRKFDPNTADSVELMDLGLPSFVVRNVLKYRAKGGKFATPESFARIYGMTEKRFEQLEPFIHISEEYAQKPDSMYRQSVEVKPDTLPEVFKYPQGTLVDVGTADTTELKKIPGIGSGIAKAIVNYRNRLGGFYSLEQLKEVKYIVPSMMEWFKLETVAVRPLNINKAGLDKLRAHPYLNFYQAKVIVEHRRKMGQIKSLSQLSLYDEFTEKDLERLAVYVAFD